MSRKLPVAVVVGYCCKIRQQVGADVNPRGNLPPNHQLPGRFYNQIKGNQTLGLADLDDTARWEGAVHGCRCTPELFVGFSLSWPGWAQSTVLAKLVAPSAACCSLYLADERGPSLWVLLAGHSENVECDGLQAIPLEPVCCHELIGTKLIPNQMTVKVLEQEG